ncbi:MAG TPA: LysE family translocator [Pseudomonadales bacterium]|nr:LysE family translocator [Pseudomonadales bacterium]
MPPLDTLLVFAGAAILIGISPGPSNLYVMSRTIAQGRRGGLVAAAGLAAGSLVHVAAAALGLSAVFGLSPWAYTLLKLAGAAYLVWLGVQMLRAPTGPAQARRALPAKSPRAIFRESVLVEVTNPKTALFFLAFLPQFVDPALGSVAVQLLLLGAFTTIVAVPCDLVVILLADRAARALARSERLRGILDRASGGVMVGLGVWVAVADRARV